MKWYSGGAQVTGGVYWDLHSWAILQAPEEGVALPGKPVEKYLRIPFPLVVAASPVTGLTFVFFLPLVGIVGFPGLLVLCLVRSFRRLQYGSARIFRWTRTDRPYGTQQTPGAHPVEDVSVWIQNLGRRPRK